jgi:hypothetical protein
MEPWGIFMTGWTVFGMLALVVLSCHLNADDTDANSMSTTEQAEDQAADFKRAA